MLLAKLSVILSSVRWTTSKTSCWTMPVWLLMATTMSRLVSFAISNLVIASRSHGGGQMRHKKRIFNRLTFSTRRRKAMATLPRHPARTHPQSLSPILTRRWGRIIVRSDLVRSSEMYFRHVAQRARSLHFHDFFRSLFYVCGRSSLESQPNLFSPPL